MTECVNPRLHCDCPKCVERRASMPPLTMMDALRTSLAERPAQAKQRERERSYELLRKRAEQRDARRNQPITRGEILDAIAATRHTMGGNVGDAHDVAMKLLDVLREAFE